MLIGTIVLIAQPVPQTDEIWDSVQARGTLVFAVDATFPPFSALDGNGNYGGFDVELAHLIAAELQLTPQFKLVSFDSLLGSTVVRQADVAISALVPQPTRTEEVFFSTPYFNAGTRLVTHDKVRYTTVAAWLAGKTLVVELGSQGDVIARRWQKHDATLQVVRVANNAEIHNALQNGIADGGLTDVVAAFEMTIDTASLHTIHVETVPYVLANASQAPMLHAAIEAALQQLEENGELPALRQKWFGTQARALQFDVVEGLP